MNVSTLFARDLKRRGARIHEPLHVIHELSEEDEPRFSFASSADEASRAPSPAFLMAQGSSSGSSVKSRRRHVSILPAFYNADSCVASTSASTNTPSPLKISSSSSYDSDASSTTSSPSPDSFRLTFGGAQDAFQFPHPPLPTPSSSSFSMLTFKQEQSPVPSSLPSMARSPTSSPDAKSAGLPVTPTTSDDDELHSTRVEPLRIVKRAAAAGKAKARPHHHVLLSPYSTESLTDLEYYANEFNQILTLNSPIPPNFPIASLATSSQPDTLVAARKDSVVSIERRSSAGKITSIPLPSPQLDPSFPKPKRSSLMTPVPTRAPPPPPAASSSRSPSRPPCLQTDKPRPPPRSSVPMDFDLFGFDGEDAEEEDDDSLNGFLITDIYEDYSQGGAYALGQLDREWREYKARHHADAEDGDLEEFEFDEDLDVPMRLPLSLPVTPIDLEADIASGLQDLHRRQAAQLPPTPSPARATTTFAEEQEERAERTLKSRWSTSTLSSVHEEHLLLPILSKSKLRTYFSSPSKRSRKSGSGGSGSSGGLMSPTSSMWNKRFSPPSSPAKSSTHSHAYTQPGQSPQRAGRYSTTVSPVPSSPAPAPLRRGRSARSSTGSSTGSEWSCESATSSAGGAASETSGGLRRKPIPVEMFLRAQ